MVSEEGASQRIGFVSRTSQPSNEVDANKKLTLVIVCQREEVPGAALRCEGNGCFILWYPVLHRGASTQTNREWRVHSGGPLLLPPRDCVCYAC